MNTHKVIRTKTVNPITGTVQMKRTYRGVTISKRRDGSFIFIRHTFIPGHQCNNWFYGGIASLKDAIAQIDDALDNKDCVVLYGDIYTHTAAAFINRKGK